MNRLLVAGLILACASTCDGKTTASPWDRAALPEPLRAMAHLSSAEIPPFPKVDAALLDPLQWPDSMVFLGRQYQLNVGASRGDVGNSGSKKVIRPGWAVYVGYSRIGTPSRPGLIPGYLFAGPAYYWNEDGRLYRRVWYEPDTITFHQASYTTYPSGELLEYSLEEREAEIQIAHNWLKFREYFGQDGNLLGVFYSKTGQDAQFWWNGKSVPEKEWYGKATGLVRAASEEERRHK